MALSAVRSLTYRLRWWLVGLAVVCHAAGLWWAFGAPLVVNDEVAPGWGLWGTPLLLAPMNIMEDASPGLWVNAVGLWVLVLLSQAVFFLPRGGWRLRGVGRGRPMMASMVIGSCMAMLLTAGLAATLLEVAELWEPLGELTESWWPVWASMLVIWGAWATAFFVYWRGENRYAQYSQLMRWLIGGTVLELLVSGGVHAFMPDPDDCHCARGSYTGLVFGCTVALWLFGPGLALLFMRQRDRRLRIARLRSEGRRMAGE